ncbi:MAG: hypothetical protein HN348_21200, partial [Proteobacteria bacterium]|nr:hypothetical protein [Pseudomonadota bacterium]
MLALSATTHAADADPFDPSAALAGAKGTLQGEAPRLGGEGPSAGIMVGFAQNLIVLEQAIGPDLPALSSVMPLNIYGGYTYKEHFRIDLFVPIYTHISAPLTGFGGAAMGDIRIQGLIPVYEHSDYFAIAIVPRIGLPTGNRNAMVGRGFHASVGGAFGGETNFGLGYLANLDLTISGADSIAGVGMGSSIDFLAGTYYRATDA